MTHEEAVAVAVEALGYALEYDHEYLSEDTVNAWSTAYALLTRERELFDAETRRRREDEQA